jgi:hypothetical protein
LNNTVLFPFSPFPSLLLFLYLSLFLLLIYIYIYIIIREGKWGWIRGGEGEGIVLEHFTVFPLLSLTLTSLTQFSSLPFHNSRRRMKEKRVLEG